MAQQGLPLRMQRIPVLVQLADDTVRITSAHAENTSASPACRRHSKDYLCACREYQNVKKYRVALGGLPLRMQRIQGHDRRLDEHDRITSAHAENT